MRCQGGAKLLAATGADEDASKAPEPQTGGGSCELPLESARTQPHICPTQQWGERQNCTNHLAGGMFRGVPGRFNSYLARRRCLWLGHLLSKQWRKAEV
jgi:hypothetical protein